VSRWRRGTRGEGGVRRRKEGEEEEKGIGFRRYNPSTNSERDGL
jgi:hypothetical protein